MICPKCGSETPDNSRFCKSCGIRVNLSNEGGMSDESSKERYANDSIKTNTIFDWLEKIGTIISRGLGIISLIMLIGALLGFFDKNPIPFLVFIGVVLVFGWLADKFPKVPKGVLAIVEIIALIICFNIAGSVTVVAMVKGGSPEGYPNITYEEAFDDYFSNPTWKDVGEDQNGNKLVKFTGNCYYLEQNAVAEIIFTVYEDQEMFAVSSVKINGNDMDWLGYALVMDAFEEYGQ